MTQQDLLDRIDELQAKVHGAKSRPGPEANVAQMLLDKARIDALAAEDEASLRAVAEFLDTFHEQLSK